MERPLSDLLGGVVRAVVPMIGYLFWRYDRPDGKDDTCAEDLAAHCRELHDTLGVRAMKLKAGVMPSQVLINAVPADEQSLPAESVQVSLLGEEGAMAASLYVRAPGLTELTEVDLANLEDLSEKLCADPFQRVVLSFRETPANYRLAGMLRDRLLLCGLGATHILIQTLESEQTGLAEPGVLLSPATTRRAGT